DFLSADSLLKSLKSLVLDSFLLWALPLSFTVDVSGSGSGTTPSLAPFLVSAMMFSSFVSSASSTSFSWTLSRRPRFHGLHQRQWLLHQRKGCMRSFPQDFG